MRDNMPALLQQAMGYIKMNGFFWNTELLLIYVSWYHQLDKTNIAILFHKFTSKYRTRTMSICVKIPVSHNSLLKCYVSGTPIGSAH